jgi:hypothetical protein
MFDLDPGQVHNAADTINSLSGNVRAIENIYSCL